MLCLLCGKLFMSFIFDLLTLLIKFSFNLVFFFSQEFFLILKSFFMFLKRSLSLEFLVFNELIFLIDLTQQIFLFLRVKLLYSAAIFLELFLLIDNLLMKLIFISQDSLNIETREGFLLLRFKHNFIKLFLTSWDFTLREIILENWVRIVVVEKDKLVSFDCNT